MKKLTYFLTVFGLLLLVPNLFAQEVQRVRIDLETPLGHTRQLLLGFTQDNSATDGFDYGYDAANIDNFPDDFGWIIEGESYIIQGVGDFDSTKKYPIGFFLSNSGNVTISLSSLENFDEAINVFIYDALEDAYVQINDQNFQKNVQAGTYLDNYFMAFENTSISESLSLNDTEAIEDLLKIRYQKSNNLLEIKGIQALEIESVNCLNLLQQKVFFSEVTNNEFKKHFENSGNIYFLEVKTNLGTITKKIVI